MKKVEMVIGVIELIFCYKFLYLFKIVVMLN